MIDKIHTQSQIPVKIRIKDSTREGMREISGDMSLKLKDVLLRFVQYTKELMECEYLQLQQQASITINWNVNAGFKSEPELPTMSVCDSFIFRLRPFVLNDEDTNFLRVSKQIGKMLRDPAIHSMLKDFSKFWDGQKIRDLFILSDDTGVLNNDATTMKYLHAFEYHRNQKKAAKFTSLQEMFGTDGLRSLYLLLLADKARAIIKLASMCEVILGIKNHSRIRYDEKKNN